MSLSEQSLLKQLITAEWQDVFAMPMRHRPSTLLDILFVTDQATVRLLGKDHLLRDGTEAFSLAVHEFVAGGWWKNAGEGVAAAWVAKSLKQELIQHCLGPLISPPRR